MKKCKTCEIEKEYSEYYGNLRACKKCTDNSRKEYKKEYRIKNKEKINSNKRRYFQEKMQDSLFRGNVNSGQVKRYSQYAHKMLFNNALKRAYSHNLEFNITLEDIYIPEFCPVLGIQIKTGTKGNYTASPSLDRIDNTQGYVKGNVKVISSLANTMKNNATKEQLLEFCKNIPSYINKTP
jgi:hypothetical protein